MNEITIRAAGRGDIPAITRIYEHAVKYGTATFEIVAPDEAEMARRQAALLAGRYPYLVATERGEIAGYAYAGPYRARPAYHWSVEDSIYIAPDLQGRGIGRLLLDRLVADSEQRGFRQMIAVIGDSAQAASIALHASAGFTNIGTLRSVGFKLGRWLDTVLMQRGLGSADATPPATSPQQSTPASS
jgi:L-amino acid N-acyltransferase YncA